MSSEDIKLTLDATTFKHLFTSTVKLNGNNYLLWAQSFHLFVGSQQKQQHLIDDLSAKDSPAYADWAVSDCSMMSWLINSMDEKVKESCF